MTFCIYYYSEPNSFLDYDGNLQDSNDFKEVVYRLDHAYLNVCSDERYIGHKDLDTILTKQKQFSNCAKIG